jgi:hypothetical protein
LIDAGADLVIGHHPHIPHRVDLKDGKAIFYSLGNGILGTPGRFHSGRSPYGLVPIVELDPAGSLSGIDLHLLAVDNFRVAFSPVPVRGREASRLLRSLLSGPHWQETDDGFRARFSTRRQSELRGDS